MTSCASLGPAVKPRRTRRLPTRDRAPTTYTESRSIYTQARLLRVQLGMDETVPMETGGQAAEPVTAQPASADAKASAPPAPASAPAVEQEQPQAPASAPAATASQPEVRKSAAKADGDEAKVRVFTLPLRLLNSPSHTWQLLRDRSLRDPHPCPVRPAAPSTRCLLRLSPAFAGCLSDLQTHAEVSHCLIP